MVWLTKFVGIKSSNSSIFGRRMAPPSAIPLSCGASVSYYHAKTTFVISTSRYGLGQIRDSNRTPLGLHKVAAKVGLGQPIGTVFAGRRPVGLTWQGSPHAPIAHRILWLDGLEPGFNRGGRVDSFQRYIYIHGVGDEQTLGRPASQGCVQMAASDLLPLADRVSIGTLVWIVDQ
jgi:hypothetical protein